MSRKKASAKEVFGKRVKFDTVFNNVVYVVDEPSDFSRKLFRDQDFSVAVSTGEHNGRPPRSSRKVVFDKQSGEGIIRGQTSKHEGKYDPGSELEKPTLVRMKTHTFWVVASGINKTVLVEKSSSVIQKQVAP